MYDGIFDDVEYVKEVLASRGHNSVDETLVFELLEDLKVRDHVVKVLLGSRLKPNSNSPDIVWSPKRCIPLEPATGKLRAEDSLYLSDTVEDSSSSDDLEVIENDVANGWCHRKVTGEAVDLTMDDNSSLSFPSTSSSEKSNFQDAETKAEEEPDDSERPLIDLTAEVMDVKEGCCPANNIDKKIEPKTEEADGSNSSSESEFGMEDYYRIREDDSDNSEEFGESDGKVSPLVSPSLGICQDLDNQGNRETESLETGENRMEEMLEENNNDPNNNLEDSEVVEQNNAALTVTENLNIEKESTESRSTSPKPGCSKDSYYADTDFCITDNSSAPSSRNQEFIAEKTTNVANIFEDEDFLVGNCSRPSDTKIDQDVFLIQKILPHLGRAKILSTIMENPEAVNRVEIALWELLPDDKPAPVFHPKRKQAEDNCPAPAKKFFQAQLLNKNEAEACSRESMNMEGGTVVNKTGIIKPALFEVPGSRKMLIKPAKFELPSSKPPATQIIRINRAPSVLKPSRLEHLNTQYNTISHQQGNFVLKGCSKSPVKDKETVAADVDEIGAVAQKPEQTASVFPTELENKPKNTTQSNKDLSATLPKAMVPLQTAAGSLNEIRMLQVQLHQPKSPRLKKASMELKMQDTGAIPKKIDKVIGKIAKPREGVRETSIPITGILTKGTVQRVEINSIVKSESSNSKKTNLLLNQNIPVSNNAADVILRLNNKSPELRVAIETAKAAKKIARRMNQVSGDLGLPPNLGVQNDLNYLQIAQKVGNMKLEKQILLGNRVAKDLLPPKVDERPPQRQPAFHSLSAQPRAQVPQQPAPFHPQPVKPQAQLAQRHLDPQMQQRQHQARVQQPPVNVTAVVEQVELRIEKQDVQLLKESFNSLINMFPDVDPNYISELCMSAKARNEGLESLIEILLTNGVNHPRVVNPEPEPHDINPDAQYENLQGIFPDAHPEYLRGIAEKYYNDPEAIKNFVQAKLENPDYPTMAEHLKKIKITEQIRRYTVDFRPEEFLEIFPDPWAHFENPQRVYRYNVIAFEFLKCIFRSHKVATILRAYRSSKHPFHMSLAAKSLEISGPDMKSKRVDKQLPFEDILLLQEYAFLKNKAQITEYIATQKRMEQQEFKKLKAENGLVECQCCYDGECMPSKCLTCSEGHLFCKSCIKTGSQTKIGEGHTQFKCFVECKGEFTLPVLQKVLEPTMFSILLRKRQEEEVKAAGLEGLVSCPFCHFASIPPPEDKIFKCLNPECMKETCRFCKELNHVPLRCDEVEKKEEARRYLEEKMTEALVRKCYSCSRPFFKDEGCNKMTCPCGAMTCYICGEPVQDYKHFNGQGSDRIDLCPLWSDNQVLNARTVRVVAEAAEKEMLKKNPNIKIDAKALMPSVPQATMGPHQQIANAHILPVQARRA